MLEVGALQPLHGSNVNGLPIGDEEIGKAHQEEQQQQKEDGSHRLFVAEQPAQDVPGLAAAAALRLAGFYIRHCPAPLSAMRMAGTAPSGSSGSGMASISSRVFCGAGATFFTRFMV